MAEALGYLFLFLLGLTLGLGYCVLKLAALGCL